MATSTSPQTMSEGHLGGPGWVGGHGGPAPDLRPHHPMLGGVVVPPLVAQGWQLASFLFPNSHLTGIFFALLSSFWGGKRGQWLPLTYKPLDHSPDALVTLPVCPGPLYEMGLSVGSCGHLPL